MIYFARLRHGIFPCLSENSKVGLTSRNVLRSARSVIEALQKNCEDFTFILYLNETYHVRTEEETRLYRKCKEESCFKPQAMVYSFTPQAIDYSLLVSGNSLFGFIDSWYYFGN